jgi:hypothetical protein
MSLFDDRDMAAITAPDFPGERLILCRNHALAAERARKREDLLRATERELAPIAAAARRKREPLRGKAEIGLAVGAVINRHKMAKHFTLEITDTTFAFARKTAEIAAEAALDGLYAVRTSLPATALDDAATVKSYKSLSLVERAIRSIKTVDLHVRPVYHWLPERVRAHVLMCSSHCSGFGRMADRRRQDLRRPGIGTPIAFHDTRSGRHAVVATMALAA